MYIRVISYIPPSSPVLQLFLYNLLVFTLSHYFYYGCISDITIILSSPFRFTAMAEPERQPGKREIGRQATLLVHSGYDFDFTLSRNEANELMTAEVYARRFKLFYTFLAHLLFYVAWFNHQILTCAGGTALFIRQNYLPGVCAEKMQVNTCSIELIQCK